jgi:hypothetical protein
MRGERMRAELDLLTAHPSRMLPAHGRYIDAPSRPAADIAIGPPRRRPAIGWVAMAASVAATAIAWQVIRRR